MHADPVALLPVTQADREAAASVLPPHVRAEVIAGDHDTTGDARELQQHFERMQDMMRRYIEPCTYVASFPTDGTKHSSEFEEPGPHDSSTNAESKRRRMDRAFISDMIYMMDGPEQRALGLASTTDSAVSGSAEGKYLVWSNEHKAWWGADHRGYTRFIERAGRYERAEALKIAGTRDGGWRLNKGNPDEIAIPEQDAIDQYADISREQAKALTEGQQS